MIDTSVQESPTFLFPARFSADASAARNILNSSEVFQSAIDRCDRIVKKELGWSVLSEIKNGGKQDECRVEAIGVAIKIALVDCLTALQIVPKAVFGVCAGEVPAAYSAGLLTLDEAMDLGCRMSRCFASEIGRGAIFCVTIDQVRAKEICDRSPAPLFLSYVEENGLSFLSSDSGSATGVMEYLRIEGVDFWIGPTTYALHSPFIEEWRSLIVEPPLTFPPRSTSMTYYSAHHGKRTLSPSLEYFWGLFREPMLSPVLQMKMMVEDGISSIVEIGTPSYAGRFRDIGEVLGRKLSVTHCFDSPSAQFDVDRVRLFVDQLNAKDGRLRLEDDDPFSPNLVRIRGSQPFNKREGFEF